MARHAVRHGTPRAKPATNDCRPPALDEETWRGVVEHLGLSDQQARIAALIARGMQDKQIAAELRIAYGTVRTYLDRVLARLGVDNRIALVVRIFEAAQHVREHRASR